MAQRTVFPTLPNTADAAYLATIQVMFQEIERQGGDVAFKAFRPWLKQRNIYDKETVEELFNFLGCTLKPTVTMSDFPTRFLACETPDARQRLLYNWVHVWNQFLTKYVFEALDVDGGGRLHSVHELYRMITSYVYAGEYITLVNFQNWIKWMAASGYIKYIGIRWGLSELGKAEMSNIRMLDVDEMLEDEAEVLEEAGTDAPTMLVTPDEPEASAVSEAPDADEEEDLPDMPPEAPIPEWEPPAAEAEAAEEEPAAPPSGKKKKGKGKAAATKKPKEPAEATPAAAQKTEKKTKKSPPKKKAAASAAPDGDGAELSVAVKQVEKWFETFDGRQPDKAVDFGIGAAQYGKNPPLFLYKMAVLAKLATGQIPVSNWEPLYRQLLADEFFEEYFGAKRSLEALLHNAQWFEGQPALRDAFASVAFELMRGKTQIRGGQALCDALEDAADGPSLLGILHAKVFQFELTTAPFWMLREMAVLGIWDNPELSAYAAVPTAAARANACRLGLLGSMYAYSFQSLVDASAVIAHWFPKGDYALHYAHQGLVGSPLLVLPYREQA